MGLFDFELDLISKATDAGPDLKPDYPEYPEPIDPGESAIKYLDALSDPALQDKLWSAEKTGRQRSMEQSLRDLSAQLFGTGDQTGTIEMMSRAAPAIGDIMADTLRTQREADITDVEALAGRATEALRASDPEMQNLLGMQGDLTKQLYARAQGLSPEEERKAAQTARAEGMARGRGFDNSSIAAALLGREDILSDKRKEAQQSGGQYFEMLGRTAVDPYMAILGRSGSQFQAAQGQQALAQGFAGQMMGPQMFDIGQGINSAEQERMNMMNYNMGMYGADTQYRSNLTSAGIGAAALMFCWVAREVYGEESSEWERFRIWLLAMAPAWFANWYMKHGEGVAQWLRNKPACKWLVRKWMNGRIRSMERNLSYGI